MLIESDIVEARPQQMAFLEGLPMLHSYPDILESAYSLLMTMGVKMMAYHLVPPFHSQISKGATIISFGFPKQWVEYYADPAARAQDPVPDIVMEQHGRMSWAEALKICRNKDPVTDIRHAVEIAEIPYAFGLPLYGPGGRDAYCAIIMDNASYVTDMWNMVQIQNIMQAVHVRISHLTIAKDNAAIKLSHRETEVLNWILGGKSRNDIATILGLAPATVDTYLRRIYEKLGVNNRIMASLRALSQNLIKLS